MIRKLSLGAKLFFIGLWVGLILTLYLLVNAL